MSRIPEDGVVYVALGNLQPAATETQLKYHALENGKAVYEFRPQSTSATFALETAHFDGELSVDLSAYKFLPASETASRALYNFDGSFNKNNLSGIAEQVQYTFYVPYYYEGMVIEVEMKGLAFNEGKLPADWENWRNLGNDIYAVQYKPSGYLNAVTINLLPTIENKNEECIITIQSRGYNTETDKIRIARDVTIPAQKLVTTLNNTNFNDNGTPDGTISIYKNANDATPVVTYQYTRVQTNTSSSNRQYRRAYNNSAVTLTGVNNGDTFVIKYVNGSTTYSGTFTISDTIETDGITVALSRSY